MFNDICTTNILSQIQFYFIDDETLPMLGTLLAHILLT